MPVKHIIIGEGAAGGRAAEKIRERDENADIKVFTDESQPLYNRIMLKNFMKGNLPAQYTRLRDENWYSKRNIELNLETEITAVDTSSKEVKDRDGNTHSYDRLLVATGGSPRPHPLDEDYDNLHYMWTMDDAEVIEENAEEADRAVVIGGGLLGIDLAIAYAEHDADTYYLIRGETWWHRGLDSEGAELMHQRMEEKGVNVMTETEPREFLSTEGEVHAVDTGEKVIDNVDSVAVAIGQEPNSEFIDVEKTDSGMIKTDSQLETSAEDVYAAGNLVNYYSPVYRMRTDKGSWDHSEEMGETAAVNMTGGETDFDYVNTYGVGHFQMQFLALGDWTGKGLSRRYSESEYRRIFFRDDRLVGAVLIGFTKGQEKIREFIKDGETFDKKERLLEKSFWE